MDHPKYDQDKDRQLFLPKTSEDDINFSARGPQKAASVLQRHIPLIFEILMALVIVLSIRQFPPTTP